MNSMPKLKKGVLDELSHIKRLEEEDLAKKRADELGLPYFDLEKIPINVSDVVLLPEDKARRAKVCVIKREGKEIMLASLHPESEETKEVTKELESKSYIVKHSVASYTNLVYAWEKYKLYKKIGKELRKMFVIDAERAAELEKKLVSRREMEEHMKAISEEDTNPFLEIMFIAAIQANSNDIHIEPEEKETKVRFRIDGILQDVATINKLLYSHVLNRLKVLAELKLNVRETAQDGRFTIRLERGGGQKPRDIDVRIALIPSYYGETIVMRLLGVAVASLDMTTLGLQKHQLEILEANLSLPNGMILTTGPTGSGKTTLLYAALNKVKKPEINIITIENPIEYQIEGITQTQVEANKGYTFENGLSAILRQDPDVVLVGEIRSEETAQIAVNAALTGHLVFSTLHTNDAPGSIERLQNLNVEVNLIPASLRLVIAQRLVRTLCPDCRQKVKFPLEHKEAVKEALALISPRSYVDIPAVPEFMYAPAGCEKCFGTGYLGRTGVFELFELNDYVEEKILAKVTVYELRKTAIEFGMLTILQHSLLKMLKGETSLEEVQRVAGDAKYIEELYGQAVLSILSKTFTITKGTIEKIKALPTNTPEEVQKLYEKFTEHELKEAFIAFASQVGASDIHIEPQEKFFAIKYRVDGILYEFARLRPEGFASLLSTIKELAGMKIGLYKRIQEGRFSVIMEDQVFRVDIRVSLIPGGYGEAAVLRILQEQFTFSLEKLGVPAEIRKRLEEEARQPNGLILATGPTGSGKTTTLYSILKLIVNDKKKIITIENPIEYKIPEILQTQINPDANYDFPEAMRAILRQDPDVILIGEVRDTLTAKTVFQAASTGHLVFSTLHTNDALGVLERLYSLEMPADQVAAILNIVIAQRLVRKLCDVCKKAITPSPDVVERLKENIKDITASLKPSVDFSSLTLFAPQGCKTCNATGFTGRVGIFEVVFMSENLKTLIRQHADHQELTSEARNAGSLFLKEDAVLKLIAGVTSLEEVERVLGGI